MQVVRDGAPPGCEMVLDTDEPEPADLQRALASAGVVGVWSLDPAAERLTLSPPVARLVGYKQAARLLDIGVGAFLEGLHRDDAIRLRPHLTAGGGLVAVEFRTAPAVTPPRSLLLRGRVGSGARGWGIVIDLGQPLASGEAEAVVNRMAEHAIALRVLAEMRGAPVLSQLVETLMIEIGFELARHLHGIEGERRH